MLLGAIVEKLSGQSYYDYVLEKIYRPAGMTSTGFYDTGGNVPNPRDWIHEDGRDRPAR